MLSLIDADAHVVECADSWDYLDGGDARFRPVPFETGDNSARKFWMVDGRVIPRAVGDAAIPLAIREMRDVSGRTEAMDRLEIAVQVLYPTFFLATSSDRPEIQVALARSYNRWMAEVCSQSKGRLRWVVVPPLASIPETLSEVRFARDHGACGVFLRGVEGDRVLADPYFFPLYEAASDMDLPLCIHSGNGNIEMRSVLFGDASTRTQDVFFAANLPVLAAFHLLVTAGIPEAFPHLRIGFIEAGAQWVPYMIGEALRRQRRMGTTGRVTDPATLLADKRLYVTCRTDNDLGYLVSAHGDEHFLVGTDYGHKDAASEVDAFQTIRRGGPVNDDSLENILVKNAARFYGL